MRSAIHATALAVSTGSPAIGEPTSRPTLPGVVEITAANAPPAWRVLRMHVAKR